MARVSLNLGIVAALAAAVVSPWQIARAGGSEACRARAAASLRTRGPEGLQKALAGLERYERERDQVQQLIARLESKIESGDAAEADKVVKGNEDFWWLHDVRDPQKQLEKGRLVLAGLQRLIEVLPGMIDQVAGQRGAAVSQLYWYTDLDKAKAEAARTGRPILSLRMLGKLTDEFSCANSRFFRTALYSNNEISDYLRDHFVLHWQSVRPVPRVTIDFGDGRKLERTLTGNSAHYVLASGGQPLDALPGLHGPQQFHDWLQRLHAFHAHYAASSGEERAERLAQFHRTRRAEVYRQWADDVRQLGEGEAELVTSRLDRAIASAEKGGGDSPLALAAARLAYTKTRAETPLLRFAHFSGPWVESSMDDALWRRIAELHRPAVKLDPASVQVMRAEFPRAAVAGELAVAKRVAEDPLLRVVRAFEDSMALDTVRNEYVLHRRIHERFADAAAETTDLDALNEWVYAELFLTPSNDPWLGLAPADVYTGLENDGRVEPADRVAGRSGG